MRPVPVGPAPNVQAMDSVDDPADRSVGPLPELPTAPIVPAGESALARIRSELGRTVGELWSKRWTLLWLGIVIIAYTDILGYIQAQGFNAFYTQAQDLGAYSQALYTTAFDHRLLYFTTNLPAGTNGNLFAVHFTPDFLALVPVYALAPSPVTLLVVKELAIALGAIPLYGLAALQIRSKPLRWLAVGAYLIAPPVMGLGWNSFDLEVLLPAPILTSIYFLYRGRFAPFLAFWLIALGVIETAAVPLLALAGFGLLATFRKRPLSPELPIARERRFFLAGLIAAVASLAVSFVVLTKVFPYGGGYGSGYSRHFQTLGANSILQVPVIAAAHPGLAFSALAFAGVDKITYLLLVFGSFAFLPLLGRFRFWVAGSVWLVLAMFSDQGGGYYHLGTHYLGYVVPFLAAGMVSGIPTAIRIVHAVRSALPRRPWTPRRTRANAGRSVPAAVGLVIVIAAITTSAIASPLLDNPAGTAAITNHGVPLVTGHDGELTAVISLIPLHAAVFTTMHLFPQVADRTNAYLLPVGTIFRGNSTYQGEVDEFLNASQYVLVDYQIDAQNALFMQYYANLTGFGVLAAVNGAYLWERGYTGPPQLWSPYVQAFAGDAMNPVDAQVYFGQTTQYGPALYHHADSKPSSVLWAGPRYTYLPPGHYAVTYWWHVTGSGTGPQAAAKVTYTPAIITATPGLFSPGGFHYTYSVAPDSANRSTLAFAAVVASTGNLASSNVTLDIPWLEPGYFSATATEVAGGMSAILYAVVVTQLSV
ncbi:MAG TPA: DUF2079 domain-containing protein [Thermoplasmata archaeon]|nr:DUF2079 domain-containing protein [Thermoplasmata archaeon]